MRILIAEDQPELRRMLVKNLTAAGYTVDDVPDGAEALAYLDAAAYDAAVLDIMMPKVDGLTVLRTLRARGSALPSADSPGRRSRPGRRGWTRARTTILSSPLPWTSCWRGCGC